MTLDDTAASAVHEDFRVPVTANHPSSESRSIGFMARALVQTTIPHRAQTALHFQRRNGDLTLTMVGHPDHGLPYGKIPRLLLAWIAQRARVTGSRVIALDSAQAVLFRDLGLQMSGGRNGSMLAFRDQLLRLMKCTLHIDRKTAQGAAWQPYQFSSGISLWWDHGPRENAACWIELAPNFYDEITTRAVPLDFGVLVALRSPLAIDLYAWATDRVFRLHKPVLVAWPALRAQFGADYTREQDFRRAFAKALGRVYAHWPALRAETQQKGLRLRPCRPHIVPRL